MQDREGLQRDFLKVFNWDEGSSRVRQQVRICSSDTGCWAKKFFQLKKDQVQSCPCSSGVPMVTLYSWFGLGHFTPNPTIHRNACIHFYPPLGIHFHSPCSFPLFFFISPQIYYDLFIDDWSRPLCCSQVITIVLAKNI